MRVLAAIAVVAVAASAVAGCKDEEPGCVPGRQLGCACRDGSQGVQLCNDDGSGFEACECGSTPEPDPSGLGGGEGSDVGDPAGGSGGGGPGTGGSEVVAGTGGASLAGGGPASGGLIVDPGVGGGTLPITTSVQLALHQDHPTGIAQHGSQVFWANEGSGTLVGCAVDACVGAEPTVLASGLTNPRAVAVDDQSLYWVEAGADGTELTVRRCPLAGCGGAPPDVLLTTSAVGNGLAIDGQHLYVGAWDALLRCPLAGCAGSEAETVASGGGITGVAVDAAYVYFVRAEERGLYRCPLAGCGASDLDSTQLYVDRFPLSIAINGATAYWTNYDFYALTSTSSAPNVNRCPAAGCSPYAPGTVVSGDIAPWGVALDAESFYWTDYVKGQITRTPRPHDD